MYSCIPLHAPWNPEQKPWSVWFCPFSAVHHRAAPKRAPPPSSQPVRTGRGWLQQSCQKGKLPSGFDSTIRGDSCPGPCPAKPTGVAAPPPSSPRRNHLGRCALLSALFNPLALTGTGFRDLNHSVVPIAMPSCCPSKFHSIPLTHTTARLSACLPGWAQSLPGSRGALCGILGAHRLWLLGSI